MPSSDVGARWITRRRLLGGVGGAAAAVALRPLNAFGGQAPRPTPAPLPMRASVTTQDRPRHLAYVWQFSTDGTAGHIRRVLADHGLGIVLKTHDGLSWMARYDRSGDAVSGPDRIGQLAEYFEAGGVPFHAWAVVHGTDPAREAQMAAQVLASGARSLTLDLEPHSGFWRGAARDAVAYGGALRQAHPDAWLVTSIDPRPWFVDRIPLGEFAAFTDEVAPQLYWDSFKTTSNVLRFAASGFIPGAEGVTPRFLLDATAHLLGRFGRPLHPIGEGAEAGGWRQFVDGAWAIEAPTVSVWRFGTTAPEVLQLLRDNPPPSTTYTVQSGDSLSAIAARMGTTVERLAEVNGIANPNLIAIGHVLRLPRGASRATVQPSRGYIVRAGDNLSGIAARHGVSVGALGAANGIANANRIYIGQVLRIP